VYHVISSPFIETTIPLDNIASYDCNLHHQQYPSVVIHSQLSTQWQRHHFRVKYWKVDCASMYYIISSPLLETRTLIYNIARYICDLYHQQHPIVVIHSPSPTFHIMNRSITCIFVWLKIYVYIHIEKYCFLRIYFGSRNGLAEKKGIYIHTHFSRINATEDEPFLFTYKGSSKPQLRQLSQARVCIERPGYYRCRDCSYKADTKNG